MHARRRLLWCLALAALAAPAGPLPVAMAQEQEPQLPTFRSDVGLVLHSVAVLDASGRPVTDLSESDFAVYEDGEEQRIELFLTPRDTALDVALVLDSSTSLFHWSVIVRRAAKTFLLSLAPEDCVYLLPFNDRVGPGTWGRGVDPLMSRRVEGIFMQGGTALYDALLEGLTAVDGSAPAPSSATGDQGQGAASALAEDSGAAVPAGTLDHAALASRMDRAARSVLQEPLQAAGCGVRPAGEVPGQPSRRRALVLLTDGADEASSTRFDQVLEHARNVSVPIFPVVVGEARRDDRLRAILQRLAGSTGGTVIESVAPESLRAAYEDVVSLLRASYLIGYRADEPGEARWREVSVRSRRPSYRLVHRDRYYR